MTLAGLFEGMLRRRAALVVGLLAACAGASALAAGVRADASVEQLVPVARPDREVYDRYKETFVHQDTRAVVMAEAPDLWTPAGLERVRSLEDALARLPLVIDVRGPLSAVDVVGDDFGVEVERLFPRADLAPGDLAARVVRARTDPLFAWHLTHPTRDLASIEVTLEAVAGRTAEGRAEFLAAATTLLDQRRPEWDRLVLSGVPAIRAGYMELVRQDSRRVVPLAIVAIALMMALAYRSVSVVVAATLTVLVSILWTVAFMAAVDIPLAVLTAFTPVMVLIISVSDTVHVVNDFQRRLARGAPRRQALAEACAESAVPCLLTEVTIACGFLSMGLINVVAIFEFGVVTAVGVLLAWLANMTVLPLALSVGPEAAAPAAASAGRPGLLTGLLGRFLAWAEWQVTERPGRVVACAAVLLLIALAVGSRVRVLHDVFFDLRPGAPLTETIRYADEAHGGIVPVAIFLEPGEEVAARSELPALEPEALRFLDRAEARLEQLDVVHNAMSVASYLRKSHLLLAGEEQARADGGLPPTAYGAAQQLVFVDDGRLLRDVLSFDRARAAVIARVPDLPSPEVRRVMSQLEAWVAAEAPPGYVASVTGVLSVSHMFSTTLTTRLAWSLAGAVAVTLAVFCVVLRSVRLAVVGLVPNLSPLVVVLGVMGALGIHLNPSTVILFSMVLVIADDDTIQYLARFRRRFLELHQAGVAEPHRRAALEVLHRTGLPMFVTATTMSAGFLLLMASEFEGTANLGLVAGLTLFTAVFADVFLTPILIMRWRPKIGG